jgi:hypothetical protein
MSTKTAKKKSSNKEVKGNASPEFYMKREMRESADVEIAQRPTVHIPVEGSIPRDILTDPREEVRTAEDAKLKELAFQDEPVTIRIHPAAGKHKDPWMFCQVNGIAVILDNGAWQKVNMFPRNKTFTTKRYCVETIARAKIDEIEAGYDLPPNSDPRNNVNFTTSAVANFVVLEDKSPRAAEWLEGLLQSR